MADQDVSSVPQSREHGVGDPTTSPSVEREGEGINPRLVGSGSHMVQAPVSASNYASARDLQACVSYIGILEQRMDRMDRSQECQRLRGPLEERSATRRLLFHDPGVNQPYVAIIEKIDLIIATINDMRHDLRPHLPFSHPNIWQQRQALPYNSETGTGSTRTRADSLTGELHQLAEVLRSVLDSHTGEVTPSSASVNRLLRNNYS